MSKFKKLSAQQQRLLDYKQMLRDRSAPLEFLPPVPSPNKLLPATADDLGNQVPKVEQGLAMTLAIDMFPDYDLPDDGSVSLWIWLNGKDEGIPLTGTRPLSEAWFDQKLTLPANITNVAGVHEVGLHLQVRFNHSYTPANNPLILRVDTQPPRPTVVTGVPDEIKLDGITAEYFERIDHVLLTYPGNYGDAKIGDVVEFMIAESAADGAEVDFDTARVIDRIERSTMEVPLETKKLTKEFVSADEGNYVIYVRVFDRKGNESLPSPPVPVEVSLIPAPKNEAVAVPLHDDDSLILLADAQTPVIAIYNYDNFRDGDQLRITIDGQPLEGGDVNVVSVPFDLPLTYKQLFNGDLGEKTIDLEWQVRRNNKFYPATAVKKALNVDFRKPGKPVDPENPGTPGSPDVSLPMITVFGRNRLEPNKLSKKDLETGALATAPIYEGHKAKDRIQLRYFGVDVPEDEGGLVELDGAEDDDTVLQFQIPGWLIEDEGNNSSLPVDYIVRHEDVNQNEAMSRPQQIVVFITPGVMVVPEFDIYGVGNDGPELHCGSLVPDLDTGSKAVEVKFTGDPRLKNVVVSFYVQGYENAKDDDNKNIPGDIILDAAEIVQKTPSEAEATSGFSVFFPWEVFDKIRNGWCTLHCSAKLDGYTTPSDPEMYRVGMFNPGDGGFCPLIP
jgi:hypothetical protein